MEAPGYRLEAVGGWYVVVRLREGACEVGCVTAYFVLRRIGEQAMVADGTELHSAEAFLPSCKSDLCRLLWCTE